MACKLQGHPLAGISFRSSPLPPSPAGDADAHGYPTLVRCALSASSQTYTICGLSPACCTGTQHALCERKRATKRSDRIGKEDEGSGGEQRIEDEGVLRGRVFP